MTKTIFKSVLLLLICLNHPMLAQLNLTQVGSLSYGNASTAGVWHYVDSLGNEYALVGAADRVSIVDVTNAANPVEVFTVPALPGQSSLWREIKTFGKYAYAVSEGGGGVICIDLSNLPASINSTRWYGNNAIAGQLNDAHTVAATDGYLYVFGANILNGGVLIADLADPMNPNYLGAYSQEYIHDGYIRNDTLWAGEIYAGQFSVIDVTDKSNPTLITTATTPGQFCHNTWLSDDGQTLFTTDERTNAPLGAFDVSDLSNISLLTTYLTDSMPSEEVHNVRVLNDFLINPSYGSQITICDAARPHNIIEIANYPTGNYLCWDASPYLPSGKIIVTDTYNGLTIYDANYIRACYLEGTVTDSTTGQPVAQATITILNTPKQTTSDLSGNYATGLIDSGTYVVEISKPGYFTKTFTGVTLSNGVLTLLDAQLVPFTFAASVVNANTSAPVAGAQLLLSNSSGNYVSVSNSNGIFNTLGLTTGTFTATVSAWGYLSICDTVIIDGVTPFNFQLTEGYSDDFSTDMGWTVSSTANSGEWVRVIPVLTTTVGGIAVNPGNDAATDCNGFAFVTGNNGGTPTTDDVDDGNTVLTSPLFDLSSYSNPYINYEVWMYQPPTLPAANPDTMFISLTNGTTTAIIDTIVKSMPTSVWNSRSRRVLDYLQPGTTMQLSVFIEDKNSSPNILETGFDNFLVTEVSTGISETESGLITLYPNPYRSELEIRLDNAITPDDITVVITDLSGRTINSEKITSKHQVLQCSVHLDEGAYLLQIRSAGKIISVQRIIRCR